MNYRSTKDLYVFRLILKINNKKHNIEWQV